MCLCHHFATLKSSLWQLRFQMFQDSWYLWSETQIKWLKKYGSKKNIPWQNPLSPNHLDYCQHWLDKMRPKKSTYNWKQLKRKHYLFPRDIQYMDMTSQNVRHWLEHCKHGILWSIIALKCCIYIPWMVGKMDTLKGGTWFRDWSPRDKTVESWGLK